MQQRGQDPNEPQDGPTQPQFGQQPYGQPYTQYQAPKKKLSFGKGCGFGCLGVVALFIVIGVIAAVAGGGKSTGAASSNTNSQTTTVQDSATADASYTSVPVNPPPTSAAPSKHVVFHLKGNGEMSSTKTFTVLNSDYSIAYTYNCSNFGMSGNFILDEMQKGNDGFDTSVANEIGKKGSSTAYMHDGPAEGVYLSVNSECSWTLTVTDGDSGE